MSKVSAVRLSSVAAQDALSSEIAQGEVGGRVEVRGLSAHFGGVVALNNVSLDIEVGSVVAVIGPNGAGKSTFLNAISGILDKNSSGEISICGRQIGGLSSSARAHAGVGRSFQDPPLVPSLSVLDNILAGGQTIRTYNTIDQLFRWRKVAQHEARLRARALMLLDFVGLRSIADAPAGSIPYGPRKLVDVARALMCGPTLLLLDEPSSGLDRNEQETMIRILNELHDTGRLATLVVEHHLDVVRACATEVVGLQAGEVIAHGPTEEVLTSDEFRSALSGT